jgi:hypothetical protein
LQGRFRLLGRKFAAAQEAAPLRQGVSWLRRHMEQGQYLTLPQGQKKPDSTSFLAFLLCTTLSKKRVVMGESLVPKKT